MDSPAVKTKTLTSTAGSDVSRAAGFTLVVLLVVLVIISLMLALVGTSMSRDVSGAEMRTAAHKVAANLRYTRTQAILTKSGAGVSRGRGNHTTRRRPASCRPCRKA
jgi:Tfp pilus assembly protein FimT